MKPFMGVILLGRYQHEIGDDVVPRITVEMSGLTPERARTRKGLKNEAMNRIGPVTAILAKRDAQVSVCTDTTALMACTDRPEYFG